MPRSKIPSPSRSQGATNTPRDRPRRARSVVPPPRSSGRLTSVIEHFRENNLLSFTMSPLNSRRSVLTDNTDIEEPRRRSWWKNLNENSRDIMEVLGDNNVVEDNQAIEELIDIEVLSQEKKNFTLDLPESSGSESINSVVLPQRKLFTHKDSQAKTKFSQVVNTRESIAKQKRNTTSNDKTLTAGTKELFHATKRTRPIFPADLLNITPNKTIADKSKELPAEPKQVKNIFGNRPMNKRKNMFANFIVSDSEDDISEIQPKVFGFQKKVDRVCRSSNRTSDIDTDMDDWKHLPSSTMVEHQLEEMMRGHTPVKKAKLEIQDKEPNRSRKYVSKSFATMQANVIDENMDESLENIQHTALELLNNADEDAIDEVVEDAVENQRNEDEAIDDPSTASGAENIGIVKNAEKKYDNQHAARRQENVDKHIDLQKASEYFKNQMNNDSPNVSRKNEADIGNVHIENDVNKAEENEDATDNLENDDQESIGKKVDENPEIESEEGVNESKDVIDNKETDNEHGDQATAKESQIMEPEKEVRGDIIHDPNTDENDEVEPSHDVSQEVEYDANADVNDDEDNVDDNEEVENKTVNESQVNELSANKSNVEDDANEANVRDVENEVSANESNVEDDDNEANESEVENDQQENDVSANESNVEDDANEASESDLENDQQEDEVSANESNVEDDANEANESDFENDQQENDVSANESNVEDDANEAHESDQQMKDSDDADNAIASDAADPDDEQIEEIEVDDEEDSQELKYESDVEENIERNESTEEIEGTPNTTHDTTGRNRKKPLDKSPEVLLHDKTNLVESFTVQGNNTSIRKTMSKSLHIRSSMAPPRESTGYSTEEGSGWDSHRTTRKTIRQTFGKDFTVRKSLRALVMEKSAARHTENMEVQSETVKFPQANSTELPDESDRDVDDMTEEFDREVSIGTRRNILETHLQKIRQENMEKRLKIREEVRKSVKAQTWDPLNIFVVPLKPPPRRQKPSQKKQINTVTPFGNLPQEVIDDMKYKPPKRFRPANASWITKRLYKFLETKLESKYDYKARVRAEKLVETIYNFVKEVRRHKTAPVDAVDALKHEMARLDIVKTHFEFYEFFHEYMPREVRVKVNPDIINNIPLPRHGVFTDILRV